MIPQTLFVDIGKTVPLWETEVCNVAKWTVGAVELLMILAFPRSWAHHCIINWNNILVRTA